jgi:hypothetical protein
MGANSKPILSVLVDAEKKEQFAKLAKEHGCSMGSLLNQAIDKMLKAKTIHVYQDSPIGSPDIEELVKRYVDEAVSPIAAKVDELLAQINELGAESGANNTAVNSKPSAKAKAPKLPRNKPLSR